MILTRKTADTTTLSGKTLAKPTLADPLLGDGTSKKDALLLPIVNQTTEKVRRRL